MRRYGVDFPNFGLYWVDGATEPVAEDTTHEVPASFSVDDIILEDKAGKKTETDDTEIEIEGKDTKVSHEKDEVKELRKQLQDLQGDLLKVSLSNKKEQSKEKGEKKERLTRTQLAQILKEHKDDPEVLLNVAEYIAETKAEETRDATLKDVNHRQWSNQMSGMANQIISEDKDGYLAANPKVKEQLSEYATNLGLGDHPIGQLAAYAILRLHEQNTTPKKDAESKQEQLTNKGQMEKTRLASLRDKSTGLTQEQLKMADKMGVKPETYAKFVGGKK